MKRKVKRNTTCMQPELLDLIMLYVNDDVTPEQRKRIQEHLPSCSECQDEARFYLTAHKIERERSIEIIPKQSGKAT